MIFDDDFVRLYLEGDEINLTLKSLGINEWPPPMNLQVKGVKYRRIRYSGIPDDVRKTMTNVARGGEYVVVQ